MACPVVNKRQAAGPRVERFDHAVRVNFHALGVVQPAAVGGGQAQLQPGKIAVIGIDQAARRPGRLEEVVMDVVVMVQQSGPRQAVAGERPVFGVGPRAAERDCVAHIVGCAGRRGRDRGNRRCITY